MSLIWTESFAGFEKYLGSARDVDVDARLRAALQVSGYRINRPLTNGLLYVVPDPINAGRSALKFTTNQLNTTAEQVTIAYDLPTTLGPVIFGFSVFIPGDYVPRDTAGTIVVGLFPTGATDLSTVGSAAREAFRIRSDLAITLSFTGTPQSAFKPALGRQSYFEVRIDDGQVSVWMNDTLVHQSLPGSAQIGGFSLMFTGYPQNWCVGNLYVLAVDDVAPNTRLGPTTRVVGSRPQDDVRADFVRPLAAPSNASVAAQDISAAPEQALQTTQVGATDIYGVEEDTATAGAALVHAVVVKSVAANLEAMPHSYTPFIRSDGVEAGPDEAGAVLRPLSPFTAESLRVIAEHPTKGIIVAGTNNSMWHSDDDGDTWRMISEGGDSGNIVAGMFSSNGNGLFIRANSQLLYCHDSSPIDEWGVMASGSSNISVIDSNGDVFAATGYGVIASTSAARRKITYPKDGAITVADIPAGSANIGPGLKWGHGDTWVSIAGGATSRPLWRSTDNLATITNLGTLAGFSGTAYDSDMAYGDGVWLHLTASQVRRSYDDGTSWTLLGTLPFTRSASSSLRYFASLGQFVLMGTNGTVGMSADGSTWKVYRLNTTLALRDSLVTKSGRLIVVGDGGLIAAIAPESVTKDLAVLGGYRLYQNIASVDPATGLPWEPSAAAVAEIGMRVES